MPFPPPGRFDSAALRRTREATGLSRPQLAALICVNVALIKSWEAKGVCPSVGNITRVAQGLGLKVSDLYTPDAASAGSLRDLRVAAGLTQQELAQRLKVRQPLVSMWERSKTRPTLDEITRYATALDVDPTAIVAALDLTESRLGAAEAQIHHDAGPVEICGEHRRELDDPVMTTEARVAGGGMSDSGLTEGRLETLKHHEFPDSAKLDLSGWIL